MGITNHPERLSHGILGHEVGSLKPTSDQIAGFFEGIDVEAFDGLIEDYKLSKKRRKRKDHFLDFLTSLRQAVATKDFLECLRLITMSQLLWLNENEDDVKASTEATKAFLSKVDDEVFYTLDFNHMLDTWKGVKTLPFKEQYKPYSFLGGTDGNLDFNGYLINYVIEYLQDDNGDAINAVSAIVENAATNLIHLDHTTRVLDDSFLSSHRLDLDQVKLWRTLCKGFSLSDATLPYVCDQCDHVHGYVLPEDLLLAQAVLNSNAGTLSLGHKVMPEA